MKKFSSASALLLLLAGGVAQAQQSTTPTAPAQPAPSQPAQGGEAKPEALYDRAGYIIGLNLGRSLKSQEIPVTADNIVRGLRDGMAGTSALTEEEINAAMQTFQQELVAKQQEKTKIEGEKNQKAGEAFMTANKAKPGVKTTASGLQYEVVTEGTGPVPKPSDQVTVHYKGTLVDGTPFDSSYDRGEPATFGVDQVIPGWTEALQLMKAGSKYKLYIPAALAYGDRGAGNVIGPNAPLVFEVELLSIGAPQAETPPAQQDPAQQPVQEQKPPTQ